MLKRMYKAIPCDMLSATELGAGLGYKILDSMHIQGNIRDMTCELLVEQIFINTTETLIEAVYTFPIPHGAVLLEMSALIGERELSGSVMLKPTAEINYEQAIVSGSSVIMLEMCDSCIYTVNLGNFLPGQRGTITYRYAYLLSWQQDFVKFRLPTTIAPRYGDAISAGFQLHQLPITHILAENRFSLTLTVKGFLVKAQIHSPTHNVIIKRGAEEVLLSFKDQHEFMDRDFVLNLKLRSANRSVACLHWDAIGQQNVALLSFCMVNPARVKKYRLGLQIVVDCSGSMAGDAILQAKAGISRILTNLNNNDAFNIICFGDKFRVIFPESVTATARSVRYAMQAVNEIEADMGGTEIGNALNFAHCQAENQAERLAILLITDGQVSNHIDVVCQSTRNDYQVFTVGVGAAVAEEFVRDLAVNCRGACELVSPNEDMAEAIYRQFLRLRQARAIDVKILWPNTVKWQSLDKIETLFAGDTLHLFAGLEAGVSGEVKVQLHLDDGERFEQIFDLAKCKPAWLALPRVAAAKRMENPDIKTDLAQQLALDYQLFSKFSNFIFLDSCNPAETPLPPPQLLQTPQMLAAAWGGTGSVILQDNEISLALANENEMRRHIFRLRGCNYASLGLANKVSEPIKQPDDYSLANKKAIIRLVAAAGAQWLDVFIAQVLPTINMALQEIFVELTTQDGWSAEQVAAAMLLTLSIEIEAGVGNDMLQAEFENVRKYPSLLEFMQIILAEDSGTELRRVIAARPKNK